MTVQPVPDAHLGIDLGTSSVKVVLLSGDGKQLAHADAGYAVTHPYPGWAETAPRDWWEATGAAVREVLTGAPGVRTVSIGLSGQMHGVVPTRADGTPIGRGVLWADSRAEQELQTYRLLSPGTRRRLANPLSPGMAGPILAWLVHHDTEVASDMSWALQPKDWLRLQLTGEVHTEPSDASATLLYDLVADRWDAQVAEALGVSVETLPPVLPTSGSCAGHLTSTAAAFLGLTAGIPVAAGAADTAAAALGSGLVAAGTAQLTIGTGIQIVTPSDHLPAGTLDPVTHFYRAATDTGHYAMAAVLNGGLALGWVRELLNASWAELYAAAERPPQDSDPIFLPHLNGERTPYLDPFMRGAWTGLTQHHSRPDLMRSALEGVAFATAEALAALIPDGSPVDHLRLAGGGAAAPAWRQMLADVLELELRSVSVPGASGRGAALLGARAAGLMDEARVVDLGTPTVTSVVRPHLGAASRYRDRRTRFREMVELVRSSSQSPSHAPA